ncbi:DHHC palmitoyltransferase domain-containing protein [Ditylenchus destructor]|uniref:Palmitoyltransferase n=1 Tax=Ditylenchus destructor TaxID=166010 RepID=A0AAD4NHD9_9BILA|nr:DHHC palmitoyltransferase domain-containing protein [Ditylenchus destructor]
MSNADLTCFFRLLEFLFRRVLGRILICLVYGILTFMTFIVITLVLPYENLHNPLWYTSVLAVVALYLMTNIVYHYIKATATHPGTPAKSSELPQCRYCLNHKPERVHHCAICNECIVKMDHHCIWVNQCVGAQNHRHFFQFLTFLVTGCATYMIAGFRTFYYNYWRANTNQMFCASDLTYLPWYEKFCDNGGEFIVSSVFFSYFLCVLVFIFVGGLCYWNFVLISSGQTYVGVLKRGIEKHAFIQLIFCPLRNTGFTNHWKRFLGLNQSITIVRHILLPSAHRAYAYENYLTSDSLTNITVL